jgi:hypothetical protein
MFSLFFVGFLEQICGIPGILSVDSKFNFIIARRGGKYNSLSLSFPTCTTTLLMLFNSGSDESVVPANYQQNALVM